MAVLDINKLEKLAFKKQLIFAYLTCERLYPNYVHFSNSYNFGNPLVLRTAIDYIFKSLFNDINTAEVNKLIKNIDNNTPHTEDFTTYFVSSALDACTAAAETLDFLIDKDFLRIKDISSFATDSVDMYIQSLEALDFNTDKNFQKKIDTHPLMKREIAVQSGIINYLTKTKGIEPEDVTTLLNLQDNNKKSNLDL